MKKYMVTSGIADGMHTDSIRQLFDTETEAFECYKDIDIKSEWHGEKRQRVGAYDDTLFREIELVEVDEDGEVVEFIDTIEYEQYNGNDDWQELKDIACKKWHGEGWYAVNDDEPVWFDFDEDMATQLKEAPDRYSVTVDYYGDEAEPWAISTPDGGWYAVDELTLGNVSWENHQPITIYRLLVGNFEKCLNFAGAISSEAKRKWNTNSFTHITKITRSMALAIIGQGTEREMLPLVKAAELAGISKQAMYDRIKRDRIAAETYGGAWYIPMQAVLDFEPRYRRADEKNTGEAGGVQ